MFLVRRVIFVAIPTFLYLFPSHQVQLLIFLTSLYIMFYVGVRPHYFQTRIYIEVFNELMILVACYHLICFSEFNLDIRAQYYAGFSYIGVILIVIIVNVSFVLRKMWLALR